MSNIQGTPDNLNHLREKNFKGQLTVSRLPTINFFTTTMTMPGFTVGEIPRRGLNKNMPEPTNSLEKDPLTVQFIIDEDMKNWLEIYDWMIGMTFPDSFRTSRDWIESQEGALGEYHPYKSMLRVVALKNSMHTNIAFDYHNAFPIALDGFDFTAAGSDEAIVATVTFVYSHMTFTRLGS